MSTLLQNKRALVTGGTRGIGRAIAEDLHESGATVLITGRTAPKSDIKFKHSFEAVDFEDESSLSTFIKKISAEKFDILINCAGINKIAKFKEIENADFQRIQSVNVHAPFRITQAVISKMQEQSWGRIVSISSIFGVISREFRASYSTSKFALDGMMAALAAEVAQFGILVNCVSPGFIDTELTRSILSQGDIENLVRQVPIKRLGQPSEIAKFVTWLSSPENTYISGQNIVIDGGFSRV